MRDLRPYLDEFGKISVRVEIGRSRGERLGPRETGVNANPFMVAAFLRELANEVEEAGR